MECACAKMSRVLALSSKATWYCPVHGHCKASLTEWITENCPQCGASITVASGHSSTLGLKRNQMCAMCQPVLIGA